MSDFLPPEFWSSGLTQPSIPFNDNFLRFHISQADVDNSTTAQPGSPANGDTYIMQSTHTGASWATFAEDDLAVFWNGTWYNYTPSEGNRVSVSGASYIYTGGAWTAAGGGASTQGKQGICVMAASMRPSFTGGCQDLSNIASAANQPDILTLNFDATTQEYAQFSIIMPKKWNEGTVTFVPYWSHPATTTNFGVVWNLQAVAVSNDDTILTNYGTAQTSTDTGGTTSDIYIGPESSAITVAGTPQANDIVFFRLSRVTGDGGDTMAVDARLHGITLYVTTDADTDA